MKVNKHIQKIFSFYFREYLISGIAFILTYLAIFLIFSFSSIVEQTALDSFNISFKDADFIFSTGKGIEFDKSGKLILNNSIFHSDREKIENFLKDENFQFQTISSSKENELSYILVFQKKNIYKLLSFCKSNNILVKSSFQSNSLASSEKVIMYDVNGYRNRFNVFSFKDQITSFILSKELSSVIGQLSRLVFIFSVVFTFYLSLLYFKERQSIYRVLFLQGYTDLTLRLIFIEFLIINFSAIGFSLLPLVLILWLNGINLSFAFWGLLYALPYLPVILFLQVILLFSNVLNYLKDE